MQSDGYAFILGSCLCCARLFTFNPHRVPSFNPDGRGSPPRRGRQPICASCIDLINAKRADAGLEPFEVHLDAYQPIPANEL